MPLHPQLSSITRDRTITTSSPDRATASRAARSAETAITAADTAARYRVRASVSSVRVTRTVSSARAARRAVRTPRKRLKDARANPSVSRVRDAGNRPKAAQFRLRVRSSVRSASVS